MPVDNTRVVSPRRSQRRLTDEEIKDIDQKRIRGELSCAECRRLKLRCDKSVPCGSCCRRGCESICPLGVLAAGQGTRFILADTDQLHEKIHEMSNRIRQLEDALAIFQSSVSDQRHPLLTDELLRIKFGSEAINAREEALKEEQDHESSVKSLDALGTLTLGSSGEMHYFGRSAGSETLMMKAGEEADGSSDDDQDNLQTPLEMLVEVERLETLFPFSSKNRPNVEAIELLESFLPPDDRAGQLCESYNNHASYFFRPIKRQELVAELLPGLYRGAKLRQEARSLRESASPESDSSDLDKVDTVTPHALASLYFVFALGALLDLKRKPYNSEAERFYDLGRASLSLRPLYDSPSMDTVQAMGLMATYHSLAGKRYSRDSAWCIMSFAAKLAQSIGLHRDSARWNMDSNTVQKRRNLFWEVLAADVSHSLALGRPPAIHLSYVDCEFPVDDDPSLGAGEENKIGFWRMKHKFARDIYYSVADTTLTAKSPSYGTVLNLDKKVREVSFPASFNPYVKKDKVGDEIFHSSELCLRDFYASQHRTVTMLYLHRSFFAQAMLDHPTNPLLSPFAPSFLTAYRSASIIIKATAYMFDRCAGMAMRLWFLMYHTFSAGVIAGTVVTRCPHSNIADVAMRDFENAIGLFEKAAEQSQRAKIALGVLLKLREKARANRVESSGFSRSPTVDSQHHHWDSWTHAPDLPPPTDSSLTLMDVPSSPAVFTFGVGGEASPTDVGMGSGDLDSEDDLAIFGGQTRVLDRKGGRVRVSSMGAGVGSPVQGIVSPEGSPVCSSRVNLPCSPVQGGFGQMSAPLPPPPPAAQQQEQEQQQQGIESVQEARDIYSDILPEVHPSLLSYLNQDAVRKARFGQDRGKGLGLGGRRDGGEASVYSQSQSRSGDQDQRGLSSQVGSGSGQRMRVLREDNGGAALPNLDASANPYWGSYLGSAESMRQSQSQSSSNDRSPGAQAVFSPYPYSYQGSQLGRYASGDGCGFTEEGGFPQTTSGVLDRGPMQGGSGDAFPDTDLGGAGFYGPGLPSGMDTAGVVEMGLSSESGMDHGWMSLMRDCGIVPMQTEEG